MATEMFRCRLLSGRKPRLELIDWLEEAFIADPSGRDTSPSPSGPEAVAEQDMGVMATQPRTKMWSKQHRMSDEDVKML